MNKLLSLNKAAKIMGRFNKARVLVIGDLIMDHFIWGQVSRISPEAPVPVVDVKSESILLGGSANVVNNIHSLGGKCLVAGIVGDDEDGKTLLKMLRQKKIPTGSVVVDSRRPTTIKTRVIAHNQQIVRFDREERAKVSPAVAARVLEKIKKAARQVDVIIISDYAKGLITPALIEEVVALAAKFGIPVAVDPKVEHFDYYRDVTIVTPNNLEASSASGVEIVDEKTLHRAGTILSEKLGSASILITRGEHGMNLFLDDSEVHIPTVAKEVYDVSGAGDTVIGVIGLALGSGAGFKEAAVIANFAAGRVVGKVGTATVGLGELKRLVSEGLRAS